MSRALGCRFAMTMRAIRFGPGLPTWVGCQVLHAFSKSDGACPQGGIALDRSGRLVGTAPAGGTDISGVIYQYDPASSAFQVLEQSVYNVAGTLNGGLTYAGGKVFYGGTLSGGISQYPAGALIKLFE